jgi:hypothetical protein
VRKMETWCVLFCRCYTLWEEERWFVLCQYSCQIEFSR